MAEILNLNNPNRRTYEYLDCMKDEALEVGAVHAMVILENPDGSVSVSADEERDFVVVAGILVAALFDAAEQAKAEVE